MYKEKASLYGEKIKHSLLVSSVLLMSKPWTQISCAATHKSDSNSHAVQNAKLTEMLRIKVKCMSRVFYQTWGLVGLDWKLGPQSGCTYCVQLSASLMYHTY